MLRYKIKERRRGRGNLQREEHPQILESLSVSLVLRRYLFDCLRISEGSLWIQSLGYSRVSGYPESAFLARARARTRARGRARASARGKSRAKSKSKSNQNSQ